MINKENKPVFDRESSNVSTHSANGQKRLKDSTPKFQLAEKTEGDKQVSEKAATNAASKDVLSKALDCCIIVGVTVPDLFDYCRGKRMDGKSIGKASIFVAGLIGALVGAFTGVFIGVSISPVVGTIIGGIIGILASLGTKHMFDKLK